MVNRKKLAAASPDLLRAMVKTFADALMSVEADALYNVEYGQVSDERVNHEGATSGADRAAHLWCERNGLGEGRHRGHPVDWQAARRTRAKGWRSAGPERNTRMLLREHPRLIIALHTRPDPGSGGTSDMCLRRLLGGVPAWLATGPDPDTRRWLRLEEFPR